MKMIEELKPLLLEVAKKSAELGQYISITAFSEKKALLSAGNYNVVLATDFLTADYHELGNLKSWEILSREPNPLWTQGDED